MNAYKKEELEQQAKLSQLVDKVLQWRADRNLNDQVVGKAFEKLVEEVQEISEALEIGDEASLVDAIGDTLVCLIGICQVSHLKLEGCLAYAYNEIKDRKGLLKNGLFVKYGDLSPQEREELDARIRG